MNIVDYFVSKGSLIPKELAAWKNEKYALSFVTRRLPMMRELATQQAEGEQCAGEQAGYVNQEPLKQLSAVSPSVTAEAVPSFSSEKGMGKRKCGGYRTLSCISFLIQTASANAIY